MNFSRCRGATGAHSGSETGQDLVHFLQVLAVQSNRQSLEQGGLFGRQLWPVPEVPVSHPNAAAISASDCFKGIGECEFFDIAADGPFTDAEFCRQVLNGIASPMAQQVDNLLLTVVAPHTLTPFHLHGRIIQVKADSSCPD